MLYLFVSVLYGCGPTSTLSNSKPVLTGYGQMTITLCLELCRAGNHSYGGVHDRDCFCSSTTAPNYAFRSAKPIIAQQCNISCPGSEIQKCGGNWSNPLRNVTAMFMFTTGWSSISQLSHWPHLIINFDA